MARMPLFRHAGALRRWAAAVALAALAVAACSREPAPLASDAATSSEANAGAASAASGPLWSGLTPAQTQALAPLAEEWNGLDAVRKKKWLEAAARFDKMAPAEQQRLHTRMREWAQLTPEQRRIARESYVRAIKLDAVQKSAKWEQYQNLPEEEKQKLAAKADRKNGAGLRRVPRKRSNAEAAQTAEPVLPSPPEESVAAPAMPPAPADAPAPAAPMPPGIFP